MNSPFASLSSHSRQSPDKTDKSDFRWQLRNKITKKEELEKLIQLTTEEKLAFDHPEQHLAFCVTQHWMSLIDPENPSDPLRLQLIPRVAEHDVYPEECIDPLCEEEHMVVPGLVHRYPDRVLLLCTDRCAAYCRYCTRSRFVAGGAGKKMKESRFDLDAICAYLREHTEVRDVVLSGGDPLMLSDEKLDDILTALRAIPHIEMLRLGTRIPVMLPQRVTPELCRMLQRHNPLYISLHCNHARELSPEAVHALGLLADHGLPLGSQTVLLRGINDDVETQRELYHALLRARVRPYYLYQCDLVRGSRHFRTPIETGLNIIASLQGHTTGYAIPQYVIDAPQGGGKIPLTPQMIVSQDDKEIVIQNYLGQLFSYPNSTLEENK